MKRWNGWGDESVHYSLSDTALDFLEGRIGPGTFAHDIPLENILHSVPVSRLRPHPLITDDPLERLCHSRGQSLPDWIALRGGHDLTFPDGIAYPTCAEEVHDLIRYADETGVCLIPYGGGTSVVGHINPLPDSHVLTVDLSRLNKLQRLDTISHLATFGAGVTGPDLERGLHTQGYTLGHFPQSHEYSTLGGWIATRSKGQQSLYYGGIERLFAGGKMETPLGLVELPCFPGSAAGPDLREIVLGSEGRMGIITEATVRITPLPEHDDFLGVFFPDFEHGLAAIREMVQARLPLSMLRLSTAEETQTTLALVDQRRLLAILGAYLARRGIGNEKCLLIIAATGRQALVNTTIRIALGIARSHRGINVGATFGKQWAKTRFRTPYLRNTLWEVGFAVDTLETATDWANIPATLTAIDSVLSHGLEDIGERVYVFSHLSHVYPSGASIYTTYLYRAAADPGETLRRWQILKKAASLAIVAHGATISHQHGVGLDHLPYLAAEKGLQGMNAIQYLYEQFDRDGIMNPGKLFNTERHHVDEKLAK